MRAFVYVAALIIVAPAHADWSHYLGPQYDNVSQEKDLTAGSINKLWSAEVGTGFSGMTVDSGRVYTMGNDGSNDQVVALDARTGAPVWKHPYPAALNANSYEGGPNATPTVAGGKVYTLGKQGRMLCLDAATGAVRWDKNAGAAEPPTWGFASCPTVIGDAVVYNVGSRGVALHKDTGAQLWGTQGSGAGYATVLPYRNNAAAILFNGSGLHALDITSGQPLWSYDWNTSFEVNAASPTPVTNGFFVSTGYDTGCAVVDVSGPQPREVWRNKNLSSHFATCVLSGGFVYGIDGNAGRRSSLVCMNAGDGRVAWKKELGFGSLRLVDQTLFVLNESGMLYVVKADSAAYTELARHRVASGKCWTVPTIDDKKLYVRNAAGTVTCYELKGGALTAEPLPQDKDVNLGY